MKTVMVCPVGHDIVVVGRYRGGQCKRCHAQSTAMYARTHRDERNQIQRVWRGANRIHKNEMNRARMAAARTLTKAQAQEVLDYYGDACVYCGKPATGFDHLHPIAKGGLHEFYNLAPACGPCNSKKHTHPIWRMLQE